MGGNILTQFHLIDGVEAVIPTAVQAVLAALPGIEVTPDLSVNVEDNPEWPGPHTPSDEFLPQTGATKLAAAGDTGQGVTVAVMDTGIDNLPDFSGRLIGGVDLTGASNRSRTATATARSSRPDRRQWGLIFRPVLGRSAGRQSGGDQGRGREWDD